MIRYLYYEHFERDPFWNMAFDEWMFGEVLRHPGSILLRLYSWNKGAITFGFNQQSQRALDHSLAGDTPVIRRITGGRALYHDPSELTYSIAANDVNVAGLNPGVSTASASRTIAGILVSFLDSFGVRSSYVDRTSPQNSHARFFHTAPCFASSSRHEIMQDSRKIVASAQRKIERTVFQHGSIKISGLAIHPAVPVSSDNSIGVNDLKALDLNQFNTYSRAFVSAFEQSLGVKFTECDLSESDKQGVERCLASVQKK